MQVQSLNINMHLVDVARLFKMNKKNTFGETFSACANKLIVQNSNKEVPWRCGMENISSSPNLFRTLSGHFVILL